MGLFSKKYTVADDIVKVLLPNLAPGQKIEKPALDRACKCFIDNSKRIITDCVRLVNSTATPAVFFERLDLLLLWLEKSVIVERTYPIFKPPMHKQYSTVVANKVATINNFVDRYYEKSVVPKILKDSTQKNICKVVNNFVSILGKFPMPQPCTDYYTEKANNFLHYNQP